LTNYLARAATQQELRDSHEAWDRLALRMAVPTVFCTWEWVFEWWECFAANYDGLVVVFITSGNDLKGIVPLVRHSAVPGRGNWLGGRRLSYCGYRDLFADQVDIICAPEDIEPCVDALCGFLRTGYTDWDVWEIPLVKADSGLAMCAERVLRNSGDAWVAAWQSTSQAPYVNLAQRTFDQHVATLDGHRRYELRKRKKEMVEKDLRYANPEPGSESIVLAELFALHTARARQKRMKSTFDGALVQQFHARFAPKAAQRGWLWLRSLKSGDHTVAAFYGFQIGDRIFYFQGGFDPAWETLSPGKTILDEVLREGFSRGYREFNFLQGGEQYKSAWTYDKFPLYSGRIYNRSVRGRLNRLGSDLRGRLKHLLQGWANTYRARSKRRKSPSKPPTRRKDA